MKFSHQSPNIRMILLLTLLLVVVSAPAMGARSSREPGYIDLDFINIPDDADEIQDINLGPVLKDVVREARANDDLEIADLLTMVHNLRMRSYSLDRYTTADAKSAVDRIASRLKNDDWDTLMKFKDGDELTTISTKYHNDNMVGLMVVVFAPDEEVMFINVVGDLDLGKLMKLASEMDKGELEEYLEKVEDRSSIRID